MKPALMILGKTRTARALFPRSLASALLAYRSCRARDAFRWSSGPLSAVAILAPKHASVSTSTAVVRRRSRFIACGSSLGGEHLDRRARRDIALARTNPLVAWSIARTSLISDAVAAG